MITVAQANAILTNRLTEVGRVDDVYQALQEFKKDLSMSDEHYCRFAYLMSLELAYDSSIK